VPRCGGARVGGRGWSEAGTPGEAGEKRKKKRYLFNLGEKGKMVEKGYLVPFLYTPNYSISAKSKKYVEKGT